MIWDKLRPILLAIVCLTLTSCYSKAGVAISHIVYAAALTGSVHDEFLKGRLGSLDVKRAKETVPDFVLGPDSFLDTLDRSTGERSVQESIPVSVETSF